MEMILMWLAMAYTTARRWVADAEFLAPVRRGYRPPWWTRMAYG